MQTNQEIYQAFKNALFATISFCLRIIVQLFFPRIQLGFFLSCGIFRLLLTFITFFTSGLVLQESLDTFT